MQYQTQLEKHSRAGRVLCVVRGILMIALGIVFACTRALTLAGATWWGGLCIAAAGMLWLADSFLNRQDVTGRRSGYIAALLWFALGLFMMLARQEAVHFLPYIAAACLAAIGVLKLVQGIRLRASSPGRSLPDMGEGALAVIVAAVLLVITWTEAIELVAGTAAIGAFLYGCMLLLEGLVKVPRETPALIQKQDREIADERDAPLRELERELDKK